LGQLQLSDNDNDVAQLVAAFGVSVSLHHLVEREAPVDDRVQPSRFDQGA
jgi:hypothetical protein